VLREALLGKACLFPQRTEPFGEKQSFRRTFGHPVGFLDLTSQNTIYVTVRVSLDKSGITD
jgi:hypothetical protein